MLMARIGHFLIDRRVSELLGPFCFMRHSLLLVEKCLSFPSFGLLMSKAWFGWLRRSR